MLFCLNGLVVNGEDVIIYGLFNEYNQEYQTLRNADAWKHDGIYGHASYKVAGHVKTHEAWGLGIYNYFPKVPAIVDNAIETPPHLEDSIHHKLIFWLNGNPESLVRSIINGNGGPVTQAVRKAAMKQVSSWQRKVGS